MVGKPNKYELDKRQTFYFMLTLFTWLTRCWTSPLKHMRASSPLCDCWHLFECFSQLSCQQLSHLSHSGSLFSYSTVAAGDILTDCGSWWAGDEDEMEMESHVRSVEYALCSFLRHNSTNLWSTKNVFFLFFVFFKKYTNKWCWEQRLLTLKLPDGRWCKAKEKQIGHSDTVLVLKWKANIFTVHGAVLPQSGSSSPNKAALAANSHCSHSATCNLDWSLSSLSCWRVDYFFPHHLFLSFFILREKTSRPIPRPSLREFLHSCNFGFIVFPRSSHQMI